MTDELKEELVNELKDIINQNINEKLEDLFNQGKINVMANRIEDTLQELNEEIWSLLIKDLKDKDPIF